MGSLLSSTRQRQQHNFLIFIQETTHPGSCLPKVQQGGRKKKEDRSRRHHWFGHLCFFDSGVCRSEHHVLRQRDLPIDSFLNLRRSVLLTTTNKQGTEKTNEKARKKNDDDLAATTEDDDDDDYCSYYHTIKDTRSPVTPSPLTNSREDSLQGKEKPKSKETSVVVDNNNQHNNGNKTTWQPIHVCSSYSSL